MHLWQDVQLLVLDPSLNTVCFELLKLAPVVSSESSLPSPYVWATATLALDLTYDGRARILWITLDMTNEVVPVLTSS